MPQERQVSFWGGELSPDLWGRTDHPRYAAGLRTALNFLVTQHGILRNRPGTQYMSGLPGVSRAVPFVVDESDALVLVFSDNLCTVYDGDEVVDTIGTTYGEDDLWTLRFAQAGNVVTVVSSLYVPREITRDPDTGIFTIADLSFDIPETPSWLTGNPPYLMHEQEDDALYGTIGDIIHPLHGDSTHPAREWTWKVTYVLRDPDGLEFETMPVEVTEYRNDDASFHDIPTRVAVYGDWTQKFQLTVSAGVSHDSYTVMAIRIYRGRDGIFGFVGETTGSTFVDAGADPDTSDPPPAGENPFEVYEDGVLVRTENPSVVTFFEDRLVMGATAERPSAFWGSALGDYRNFDRIRPPDDDDSYKASLNSNRNEKIRNLVPRQNLIALTTSAEWVIGGAGEGEVVTPNSIAARPLDENGCADAPAVAARGAVVFVQASGSRIMAVVRDANGYRVLDLSIPASHFFDGFTVVEMAYAKNPFSVLWVVRNDGTLLSMTYAPDVPDEHKARWTQHAIEGGGLVESVTVIPNGAEDAVYLVVNRDGERSLERMANRLVDDVRDAVFLDASATYSGKNLDEDYTATISDPGAGGDIGATIDLQFAGETSVGSATGMVLQLDDPDGGQPLKLLVGTHNGASQYDAQVLNREVPDDLWDEVVVDWFACVPSLTGLAHLEGQEVTALVDGGVVTGLTVTAGSVVFCETEDFASYVAVAHAGLAYDCDIESLAVAPEKGKQKIVTHATVELQYSRGGYLGHELGDDMVEIRDRRVSDGYDPLQPRQVDEKVAIPGEWKVEGYVAFRQSDPLPVTVLSIAREVQYGG